MKKIMLLILCLTFGLYGFSPGCGEEKNNDDDKDKIYHVTYSIDSPFCPSFKGNISYRNQYGVQYLRNAALPWTYSFEAHTGNHLYISATDLNLSLCRAIGLGKEIRMSIYCDGNQLKHKSCCDDSDPNTPPECREVSISGVLGE